MNKDQYRTHETSSDRERERQIIQAFCKRFHVTEEMAPLHHHFDASLWRGNSLFAIVEVKHRNSPFGRYPDYHIDKLKIDKIIDTANARSCPAVVIVSFQGDVRYLVLPSVLSTVPTSVTKRRDRDELPDEVYNFPLNKFQKL